MVSPERSGSWGWHHLIQVTPQDNKVLPDPSQPLMAIMRLSGLSLHRPSRKERGYKCQSCYFGFYPPRRSPPSNGKYLRANLGRGTFQLKVISKERRERKLPLEALTQSAGELTKSLNLLLCHNQQIQHNGFRICLSTQKLKVQNLHYYPPAHLLYKPTPKICLLREIA